MVFLLTVAIYTCGFLIDYGELIHPVPSRSGQTGGGDPGGRRLAASGNGHNIKIKYFSIIVTFSEGFHTTK